MRHVESSRVDDRPLKLMGKKKRSPRDVNAYISSVEKCRDKVARREFSHFAGDSAYLLLFLLFLFLTRAAVTSAVMLRQLMRVTESVNLLSLFFVFFCRETIRGRTGLVFG